MRVRIALEGSLADDAACSQLWWQLPAQPTAVQHMVRDVLAGVGLGDVPLDSVQVSLDGFAVLPTSSTGLLRDGDLLQLERRAPSRKRAREEAEDAGGEVQEKRAKAEPAPQPEKRPSRSARRKAAKRRWRRQGNATGLKSHPLPDLLTAKEKKKEGETSSSSSSSDDSDESSSSSSESETSSSSSESDSDDSSSPSSSSSLSSESEDEEQQQHEGEPILPDRCSEEEFQLLLPFSAVPAVGRVVAYKLLEIGEDFAPRISEPRLGRVTAVDGDQMTLEPYPDPAVHPLQYLRDQIEVDEDEEEEEEGEEPPSAYDEAGVLTAELSSFAELRYFDGEGGKAEELLGPSDYARQGPPTVPQAPTPAAATTTALASLMEQLQRRRAELAAQEQGTRVSEPQSAPEKQQNPQGQRAAGPASRGRRRRSGALHSAIGPVLNMLRGSDDLEN